MLRPPYRTRFPGRAKALYGAPEVGVEACGASVEQAEVAVLLDHPRGVLDGSEVADGVADLVDRLEDAGVDGLVLQCPEHPLDDAIVMYPPECIPSDGEFSALMAEVVATGVASLHL